MNKIEVKLTERDYEIVIERASDIFKNTTIRFGDRSSLAKAYFQSFSEFFKRNDYVLDDEKLYKKIKE
jgi:hypothetical protein